MGYSPWSRKVSDMTERLMLSPQAHLVSHPSRSLLFVS